MYSIKPLFRFLVVVAWFIVVLAVGAGLHGRAQAQSQPFPTVPPPNATFPAPMQPIGTAVPGFAPLDFRPGLSLGDRLRQAAGYLAGGVAGLALGGAALWLGRRQATSLMAPGGAGVGRLGPGPWWFKFRPRLRKMTWIIPSGAGILLLGMAASRCVPPKTCYATAGGVQFVVPCDQVEGSAEEQLRPTATPSIDCPDPGRGGTDAYEEAKSGGRHSPYLEQARGWSDSSLRSALRSYEANVFEHLGKLGNPAEQDLRTPWDKMDPREQQGLLKQWCTDVVRNRELADVILGIMRERGLLP